MQELMKGHCWHKRKGALNKQKEPIVTYPVMVEVKHDEIRVRVTIDDDGVHYESYARNPLYNLEQFSPGFLVFAERFGVYEFDMGFEVGGNFDKSRRWVRSSTSGIPGEIKDDPIKWFLFGLPQYGGNLLRQFGERTLVAKMFQDYTDLNVVVPHCEFAECEEHVDIIYAEFRRRKFEGAMVKQPEYMYERNRTDGWLKYKPKSDASGVITKLIEAVCGKDQPELGLKKGDLLGRIGSVEVKLADGSEATPFGIAHALGKDMLDNPEKYLGETCDFFYMERDTQGGYRHPTFYRIREAV